MSDIFYEDDTVIPYVLTFKAERVHRHLSTDELHRFSNARQVIA